MAHKREMFQCTILKFFHLLKNEEEKEFDHLKFDLEKALEKLFDLKQHC